MMPIDFHPQSGKGPNVPRVLVIDDQLINRMTLERMLSGEGFAVQCAESGPEGRAMALAAPPDLILLDIVMPAEDGYETLALLKSIPATTDVPVILVSALGDVGDKVEGFYQGAVDYITKPFDAREVLARIRTHLKLAQAYKATISEQVLRLSQVRKAQRSMLVTPDDEPKAHFSVVYEPVLEAGGDFYDVLPVLGGYGYFVADVAGHDLGASFVTSSLKVLLRQNSAPVYSPQETLKNMNGVLHTVMDSGRYLTACYALLDGRRANLFLLGAGHPPAVRVPADGGQAELLEAKGDILGAFPAIRLEPLWKSVSKGDRIFLYTDGLLEPETGNGRGRAWARESMLEACRGTMSLPRDRAVRAVAEAMGDSSGRRYDDRVLMCIEV